MPRLSTFLVFYLIDSAHITDVQLVSSLSKSHVFFNIFFTQLAILPIAYGFSFISDHFYQASLSFQGSASVTSSPPVSTPVTGHKRMVIPNQPPLTATKKSAMKPQPAPQAAPIPVTPIGPLKPQPQPVPASYTTASTPSRPTFNVQVKSAQPSPHYMAGPSAGQTYGPGPQGYNTQPVPPSGQCPPPSTRSGADYAYIPPPGHQPEPGYGYTPNQGRYYEPYYAAGPGYGGRNDADPSYGQQQVQPNTWKREPGYAASGAGNQNPPGMYPVSGPKKTYITDPAPAQCAPPLQPKVRS